MRGEKSPTGDTLDCTDMTEIIIYNRRCCRKLKLREHMWGNMTKDIMRSCNLSLENSKRDVIIHWRQLHLAALNFHMTSDSRICDA